MGWEIQAGLARATIGTNVAWDEAIDFDLTKLDGGGGINPNFLTRDPKNNCTIVMPHQYLRVNTIFEVVKSHRRHARPGPTSILRMNGPMGRAGGAWTISMGRRSTRFPWPLPQFAGCSPVPAPDTTPDDGWTTDLKNIRCYDSLHVQAVLNQIDGYTHDRSRRVGVPTLFGTNFQAVSVGEKLKVAGYTDVLGTPSAGLAGELDFVDQSLGEFVAELKKEGIYDDTLIIVGAKHGQSPIDVSKRVGIGGGEPTATIGRGRMLSTSPTTGR